MQRFRLVRAASARAGAVEVPPCRHKARRRNAAGRATGAAGRGILAALATADGLPPCRKADDCELGTVSVGTESPGNTAPRSPSAPCSAFRPACRKPADAAGRGCPAAGGMTDQGVSFSGPTVSTPPARQGAGRLEAAYPPPFYTPEIFGKFPTPGRQDHILSDCRRNRIGFGPARHGISFLRPDPSRRCPPGRGLWGEGCCNYRLASNGNVTGGGD